MLQALGALALKTGMYDTIRSAYHFVGNRPYYHLLRARQALYAPLVQRGSLVFDIGANQGDYALTYRRLGARVICVEPNPTLASKLRARFGAEFIVESAVSDMAGRATLHLGSDTNYSTIVESWLPITKERDRLSTQTVDVDVTTLDGLIARFGVPALIKIDVEANELPVLRGLTHPVDALVFEYQCPLIDQIAPALDHLDSLVTYKYGLLQPDGLLNFGTRDQVEASIGRVCASGKQSGDIYALRQPSVSA
jgi:FkbM family methyltransferase